MSFPNPPNIIFLKTFSLEISRKIQNSDFFKLYFSKLK